MSQTRHTNWISAAVLLALGVAAAGWLIGTGFREGRQLDRYVTVKGVAERTVMADLAIWPIVFTVSANDLGGLQQGIDSSAAKITEFLSTDFDSAWGALPVTRDVLLEAARAAYARAHSPYSNVRVGAAIVDGAFEKPENPATTK